jgi:hypothetical protein
MHHDTIPSPSYILTTPSDIMHNMYTYRTMGLPIIKRFLSLSPLKLHVQRNNLKHYILYLDTRVHINWQVGGAVKPDAIYSNGPGDNHRRLGPVDLAGSKMTVGESESEIGSVSSRHLFIWAMHAPGVYLTSSHKHSGNN